MEERLQKIISRYGLASRRQAEQLLRAGRIRVNGNTASLGDTAIDGEDVIEVDGKVLRRAPEPVYLMLHKPRGFVTTLKDEKGRRTAAELVADCGERVYPVGRLDLNSEGLLLFTNDGAFADAWMHPSGEVEKEYLVWISDFREGAEAHLRRPIEVGGRRTSPAKVDLLQRNGAIALLRIVIHEGRNRQIRRLCEAAQLTVTRLCRVREGELSLGDLPTGKWRYLTENEKNYAISSVPSCKNAKNQL